MEKTRGGIREVGEKLCAEFQRVLPLNQSLPKGKKKLTEGEIKHASEAGLKNFYETARAEIRGHRLGIIGRARVAFALQQRLLDLGYSPMLVKQVLFAMLASAFVGNK